MKLLHYLQCIALLIGLLLIASACNTTRIEIHISPNGDDKQDGNREYPLRSLEMAQQKVREELARNEDATIVVFLDDGDYYIKETLVLTAEDCPSSKGSVTWRAENEKKASITGAVQLSGWKKLEQELNGVPTAIQNKIVFTKMPEINGKLVHPKVLFSDVQKLKRARGEGFEPVPEGDRERRDRYNDTLVCPRGIIKEWQNWQDVELLVRPNFGWVMNILSVKAINQKDNLLVTTLPASYPMRTLMWPEAFNHGSESCWLENIFEALENPGDWVSDSKSGNIYLVSDGNPPNYPVFAPVLKEFIRIEGTDEHPVKNLNFKDLEFKFADRDTWTIEDIGLQHDWELYNKSNAVFRMKGAENCTVDGCRIRNCGNTGIRLDLYAQKNRIINNEIYHMGGTGVLLAGYGPGDADVNKFNEVLNNHIHHCGEQYWMCSAIHVWQSGNNRIANNEMHDMPYIGLIISGVRPSFFLRESKHRELYGTVNREAVAATVEKIRDGQNMSQYRIMELLDKHIYTDNNIFENNEIHNVMQVMSDGDAIYLSATGWGNILRGNFLHDVVCYGAIGHVIRNDGPQYGTSIEDNIILNCSGGINLNDGSLAQNNYIINVTYPPGAVNLPPHPRRIYCGLQIGSDDTLSPFKVTQNVIYFENTAFDLLYYGEIEHTSKNLFWSATDPEGAQKMLTSIREEHGTDMDSKVADPGFKDASNGDFTIEGSSPLDEMGIKRLNPDNAGLLKERVK